MSILNIINELAADNSRLAKEAILKREKNNIVLIRTLKATYNPYVNYWLAKIPEYSTGKFKYSLDGALNRILDLANRTVTGNAAIEFFKNTLEGMHADDAKVLELVIQRDMKCGISEKTINKIWPSLIPTFAVCLAHKDTQYITYPAYAQVKFDGLRAHCVFDGRSVTLYTRNGKVIDLKGALDASACLLMKEGEVWDGEILFRKDGKILDRKTGNGLGNKAVRGTISDEEASMVLFCAWDIVDFGGTIPYSHRYAEYVSRWDKLNESKKHESKIWIAEATTVNSEEEAFAYYDNCIKHGHEGAMIKNMDFKWEGKRVRSVGKMKAEEEVDLIVTGWQVGQGRNADRLGNLICKTQDGLLEVNVGTGFSDAERDMPPEYFLDKIVTVKYNQVIKAKGEKAYSLFLPRFVEIREDKNVANKFEEVK